MTLSTFKTDVLPIKNKLYRLALGITNNPAEAEDVVQEVFIKVWESRAELAQVSNLPAWCMTLTRNKAIDKKRLKANQMSDVDALYGHSSAEASPHRQAELSDAVDQVRRLMRQLPDPQRQAMQLRDVEGMSYQEIGEALGQSISQVKTNIFRARKGIKNKMQQLWVLL